MSQTNFINGNFDLPLEPINSFKGVITINSNTNNYYNDTSLPNWVVTGNTGGNTTINLSIGNGNIIIGSQLNPNLPLGITQFIGLLAQSTNTSGYINISQTITINTIGYYSLSFYVAPSNPLNQYATYTTTNNIINMSISNDILNSNISIVPSLWQWNQIIYNIYIPSSGNYTFTFQQSYTGPYSTTTPYSVIFVTGFNLNLQQINTTWNQFIKADGGQANLNIGSYQVTSTLSKSGVIYAFDFDSLGNLYVGGTFTCFAGFNNSSTNTWLGVIKWDGTSASLLSNEYFVNNNSTPDNTVGVQALIIFNDIIYIGGTFNKIGNNFLNCLAKFNLNSSSVWEPIIGNYGSGVLLSDGPIVTKLYYDEINQNLYIGGVFDEITDGISIFYTANSIASINLNTNSINNNTLLTGVDYVNRNGLVIDLLIYDNILYICGFLEYAGGASGFSGIASWNIQNETWTGQNFQGGFSLTDGDPSVFTFYINPSTSDLYIGGYFDKVGGTLTQNNLAVWNITSEQWISLPGNLGTEFINYVVTDIYFPSYNNLYLGGGRESETITYNGLLEINLDTLNIIQYMSSITPGGGVYSLFNIVTITKTLIYNNRIYIAGSFSTINNTIINNISYYQQQISNTNFIVDNVGDLSLIFYPWDGIIAHKAPVTNFKINNVQDLNTIFQSINYPPTPSAQNPTIVTNYITIQSNFVYNTLYTQTQDTSDKFVQPMATSENCQYIYIHTSLSQIRISYSGNYGLVWNSYIIPNETSFNLNDVRDIVCNSSGQYVLVIADYSTFSSEQIIPTKIDTFVYQSTDYGSSWSRLQSLPTNILWTTCSMNENGNIIYICATNTTTESQTITEYGIVKISYDFGDSFNDITPVPNLYNYIRIATSNDGSLTLVSFRNPQTNETGIYKYNNFIWSNIDNIPHRATSPDYIWEFIKISYNGSYILIGTSTYIFNGSTFVGESLISLSTNLNEPWQTKLSSTNSVCTAIGISQNGNYMYYSVYEPTTLNSYLYRSTNYGSNFISLNSVPFGGFASNNPDQLGGLYFIKVYKTGTISNPVWHNEVISYTNVYDLSRIFLPLNYNTTPDITITNSLNQVVPIEIKTSSDKQYYYVELTNNSTTYYIKVNYSPSINLYFLIAGGGGKGGNGVYNFQTFQTARWVCASGGGGGSGEIIVRTTPIKLNTGVSNISFTASTSGGTLNTGYVNYISNNTQLCIANSGGNGGNATLISSTPGGVPTDATPGAGGVGATNGLVDGNSTLYQGLSGQSGLKLGPTSGGSNPVYFASGGNGGSTNSPHIFSFGGTDLIIGQGGTGAYRDPVDFEQYYSVAGIRGGAGGGGAGMTAGEQNYTYGAAGAYPYILLYWSRN